VTENELSHEVIGACMEVHKLLGPGLLESAYQECLGRELSLRDIPYEKEKPFPVEYKGVRVDCGYRVDFLVAGQIVLELKSVEGVLPVHEAQVLTYLKLAGCRLGLLVNFNVPVLKDGIRRFVINV
jgi:GxxExxY protein